MKDGGVYEHYSPELVKNINEEINKVPIAPNDWKNTAELVSELSASYSTIENIVNKYKETNPEYFKLYRNSLNRKLDYFSPDMVNMIYKVIEKKQFAPEGWMTNRQLAQTLGTSNFVINNIANTYRQTNPEYFKGFKINRGQEFEHYAPELVKKIDEEVKNRTQNIPEVPESWQSIQDIAEKAGVSREEAEKIAKKLRQQYQGQFGKFKGKE